MTRGRTAARATEKTRTIKKLSAPPAAANSVKTRRGGFDITFLVLVLILVVVGLVMLFSASYATSYDRYDGNSFYYISNQAKNAVLGIIAMLLIMQIDYHFYHKVAWLAYAGSLVLLVLVLVLPSSNPNAARWIDLGFVSFQPSEVMKFALVILFAHHVSLHYKEMKRFKEGLLFFGVVLAPVVVLMLLQPHLSGTVLIMAISAVMMFVGGTDWRWFAGAIIVAALIVAAVIFVPGLSSYAGSRFEIWLDPFSDPTDKGFQTIQSLYAISSGGLMGVGFGASRQKYLWLPESQNDFIFSIICEELGFVGAVLVVLLFALLVWRGFVIAARAKDRFGTMLAVGLTAQVGIQTFLNIAVVTNTVPNTGISLPFFSFGGTSLIMLLASMGVILSVSRNANLEKE